MFALKNQLLKISAVLIFLLFVPACTKVPLVGRSQLSLISNTELLPMSFEQYNRIISESSLMTKTEQGKRILEIGTKMAKAVDQYMRWRGYEKELQGFDWEFHLIDSDAVNAWCLPGGKIAFYRGILPICETDEGIAAVMGHEIAHAIASHGRERVSNGLLLSFLSFGVQVAMGEELSEREMIFLQAFGIATQLGELKFSRKHELEADKLGLYFMAMAGYDPREAPSLWDRMEAAGSGEKPLEFLSTHPSYDRRKRRMWGKMDIAIDYYNNPSRDHEAQAQ
ncbi:MAG: M48 family peptidase [Mongoliibacter sp.]|nr:MAG: M48 family peptidase [Mongoliibacter sp.]